jgi:histidinol-phosphatase (PHP family)
LLAVLTDYHVHLREDSDPRPSSEEAFTEANVERYVEAASKAGIEELGCSEHVYRFAEALEIWQHPFWEGQARDDLGEYCEFVRSTPLRLGIEADFVPGAEDRIANLLEAHDFDYVLGSVHFIGEVAVDHDGFDAWERTGDSDKVWARYFEMVTDAARSGLFDILSHPDLVKVWGRGRPLPDRDPRFYYEPFAEAVAETGVAVEVSTAGLRKPVCELYPAPALAEMLVDAGVAFALSSDAHVPGDVGHAYDQAVETMRGWGIERIATFERRDRTMEPLG